jgi:hypothetical protein
MLKSRLVNWVHLQAQRARHAAVINLPTAKFRVCNQCDRNKSHVFVTGCVAHSKRKALAAPTSAGSVEDRLGKGYGKSFEAR